MEKHERTELKILQSRRGIREMSRWSTCEKCGWYPVRDKALHNRIIHEDEK